MSFLHKLPKELVHAIFEQLNFKEKRSVVLVDKYLHDICAPRLSIGLGLLDMDCFDLQARRMTIDYLAQRAHTAENLLIHYKWPAEGSVRNAAYEKNFERILDIYRGRSTSKFVGFSVPTVVGPEPYSSIKTSLKADTLPERFVLPRIENYLGAPTYSMMTQPTVLGSGAIIKIVQTDGKEPDKQTELYVRPWASLDAARVATEKENRTVTEVVIFGNREAGHNPQRSLKRWEVLRRDLGLMNLSSVKTLRLYNCNTVTLSKTTLPASLEALAFIDNCDDPATFQKYNQGHALEQLAEVQKNTPGCKGLAELVHLQRTIRLNEGYSTVDPEKLINFVRKQDRIAPTLITFSFRDGEGDVVYPELKHFADKSNKVKAWGGNWSYIIPENHNIRANFQQHATDLADSLSLMNDLDTVAFFTPGLTQTYTLHDIWTEKLAVGKLLHIFDEAGLKIQWVHIVHRAIRNDSTWWSTISHNGITYRAVKADDGHASFRAEEIVDLPDDVFETRWKLGADFVSTYGDYERSHLRELSILPQQVVDHTRKRLQRREDEEALARKRKSYRQHRVRRVQKRSAGDDESSDIEDGE
ncbi:uncharacterized protein N0V89_003303 [Didymosphaeria variabile]|uniref:F-box domain-containing protein n=1 Tax=Didymosphaeria variabile TaxID=1932322 RepID=A0A9W9CFC9_9PLEO|nr:uncharacterized protein N0V89_003303 [Didymosphaeria variabile]KAJ4358719.1 hypothetical protein N0V89_003303 [Didymosphaeria variabile]